MLDFLSKTYYGSTVTEWAIALTVIFSSLIIGKVVYWFFQNVIGRLTKKTETDLDDIILDMVEEPVTMMIVITGIRLGINQLELSEKMASRVDFSYEFIFTLLVSWTLARTYDALHKKYIAPLAAKTETEIDDYILPVINKVVKLIIWGLGIVLALNNAGYDISAILAGLGIGGLAFALAMQHTVGNLMGGLNIFIDRHIKIGDRIQLKGDSGLIDGVVQEIGLRTTKIKTRYEGRIVMLPNSLLTSTEVVNVESEDGRQVFNVFKLSPTTSPDNVDLAMAEFKRIAQENPNTKELVVTGLIAVSEISYDIMLLFWVKPDASNVKTKTAIFMDILRFLEKSGIKLTERSQLLYNKDIAV